jgi:hypothetical protein
MSQLSVTYRDYSRETSNVGLLFADVAAGGANFDTVVGLMGDVVDAINDLTLCVQAKVAINQDLESPDPAIATDEYAQREFGLRVFYTDDVNGKTFFFTIPGPDMSNLSVVPGTDLVDLSDTEMAALITAVEAGCKSPYGNAITVRRGIVIGRRA